MCKTWSWERLKHNKSFSVKYKNNYHFISVGHDNTISLTLMKLFRWSFTLPDNPIRHVLKSSTAVVSALATTFSSFWLHFPKCHIQCCCLLRSWWAAGYLGLSVRVASLQISWLCVCSQREMPPLSARRLFSPEHQLASKVETVPVEPAQTNSVGKTLTGTDRIFNNCCFQGVNKTMISTLRNIWFQGFLFCLYRGILKYLDIHEVMLMLFLVFSASTFLLFKYILTLTLEKYSWATKINL